MNNFGGFIAVHLGAGYHPSSIRKESLSAAKSSCKVGCEFLNIGAVRSCTEAVQVLEDCPVTNAGIGSNLTTKETVECDASIMDGSTLCFGAVGAVPGVKNPICLAEKKGDSQPLLQPLLIVGIGARELAGSFGLQILENDQMVTQRSLEDFRQALNCVQQSPNFCLNKLDTVGAVAVDSDGKIGAGCSSGGILLKQAGRVGQAATFGAGCWAEETEDLSVAASVSGCGENIMRTQLAKRCCERILDASKTSEEKLLPEELNNCFSEEFLLESRLLRNQKEQHKIAGVLLVKFFKGAKTGELAWIHNSDSMCVGFMKAGSEKAKSLITELEAGSLVAVHGISI